METKKFTSLTNDVLLDRLAAAPRVKRSDELISLGNAPMARVRVGPVAHAAALWIAAEVEVLHLDSGDLLRSVGAQMRSPDVESVQWMEL